MILVPIAQARHLPGHGLRLGQVAVPQQVTPGKSHACDGWKVTGTPSATRSWLRRAAASLPVKRSGAYGALTGAGALDGGCDLVEVVLGELQ